jgi:hypothetical protein
MVVARCVMEGRLAQLVSRIRVRALIEQTPHGLDIARCGRIEQSVVSLKQYGKNATNHDAPSSVAFALRIALTGAPLWCCRPREAES